MLVSHSHRFIFIKPTKVGGTSVEIFLQPACQSANLPVAHRAEMTVSKAGIVGARANFSKFARPEFYNHMTAADLKRALPLEIWENYRKVSVVRNPFARHLSAYFMLTYRLDQEKAYSLEDVRSNLPAFIRSEQSMAERDFLRVDGTCVVDTLVRFEHLAQDVARLCTILAYAPPTPLDHFKRVADARAERPISDFYTPEAIAAVQNGDGWYLDRFDYPNTPDRASPATGAAA